MQKFQPLSKKANKIENNKQHKKYKRKVSRSKPKIGCPGPHRRQAHRLHLLLLPVPGRPPPAARRPAPNSSAIRSASLLRSSIRSSSPTPTPVRRVRPSTRRKTREGVREGAAGRRLQCQVRPQ